LINNNGIIWETQFGTFKLTDNNIKWILSNVAKTSMYNPNRSYVYNKAFYENCIKTKPVKKCNKKPLKMFQQIRDWAEERGYIKRKCTTYNI
jgi:hypothetical protein